MAKLHEVLAVEGDLEGQLSKVLEEAANTFHKKENLFEGHVRTLTMFDENREKENATEEKPIPTTVDDKLEYLWPFITRAMNNMGKKWKTNQVAQADIVVDDKTIATGVPGTMLLALEAYLKRIREVYDAIPTLPPGVKWEHPEGERAGVYHSAPEQRLRTEKQLKTQVVVQPTKEHPAQVKDWTADVPVGNITVVNYSGKLMPKQKSDLLGRIDTLLRAVKKARQRANRADAVALNLGDAIRRYIHP